MKEVKNSVRYVVENSVDVKINAEAVSALADKLSKQSLKFPQWDYTYHYFDGTEKTLHYLFLLDTLNFCFWPSHGQQRWTIKYNERYLSGYNALAAALKHAMEQGIPLDDPGYLASIRMADLEGILGGKGQLQLMDERLRAARELGSYLLKNWHGSPAKLVQASRGSALWLARKVATDLTSFRDVANYRGRPVYFYKRAQILTADIYGAFQGRDWGNFCDMDQLTAFADYKLPQVLRHLGVLKYSDSLAARVDSEILIPKGTNEEIEIRAHTIWAIELLCDELREKGKNVCAFELDWILWNMGQKDKYRKRPYHKTVTIFY